MIIEDDDDDDDDDDDHHDDDDLGVVHNARCPNIMSLYYFSSKTHFKTYLKDRVLVQFG